MGKAEQDASDARFLSALDPDARVDGGQTGTTDGDGFRWPAAVPPPAADDDGPVEAQLLEREKIAAYLSRLRAAGNRAIPDLPPLCDLPRNWTAERHPLLLAEFLAYKSALVYRTPRAIHADLMGRSPATRQPYAPGVKGIAFFDSCARAARLEAADAEPAGPSLHRAVARFLRPSAVRHGDTQALAFSLGRTGYVILRGTESLADLAADFQDATTDEAYARLGTVAQTLVGSPHPARHTGFAIAWGAIAPDVEAWVREQRRAGNIDRIVLSGHSLGGALAILGAYHFAQARLCPVHAVVTFGAPKVAGVAFRDAYESPSLGLKDRTLRLEAADDLVTLLDRRWDHYHHVGHVWRLAKRPLRPWWQMVLWASLMEPEVAAERRVQRKRRVRGVGRAGANAEVSPQRGHNHPAPRPRPDWRGFARGAALRLVWFAARRLLRAWSAHSLERRYALYLSTLSYRRIRAHHVDLARLRLMTRRSYENETILMSQAFRRANSDFDHHLALVRGRHPKTFRSLRSRPLRVSTPDELRRIEKHFPHFLA